MGALVAVLREQDQSVLESLGYSYSVEVSDGFVNVVLANFPTPGLDPCHVDLLLRLPIGFPDATPDMFWVSPALTAKGAAIPGTELTENYLGRSWQRWSRHIGGQWRPGVDNLETYLAYVRRALAMAGGK
ncbi:E2/UBC family protein [Nocardioides pakistanensis]